MTRRSAAPTAKAIAFFHKSVGRRSSATERKRLARALARAEAEASARGWRTEWVGDPDGDDEMLGAILRDHRGHVLAQLWAIGDASRDVRRRVEAELALEALE